MARVPGHTLAHVATQDVLTLATVLTRCTRTVVILLYTGVVQEYLNTVLKMFELVLCYNALYFLQFYIQLRFYNMSPIWPPTSVDSTQELHGDMSPIWPPTSVDSTQELDGDMSPIWPPTSVDSTQELDGVVCHGVACRDARVGAADIKESNCRSLSVVNTSLAHWAHTHCKRPCSTTDVQTQLKTRGHRHFHTSRNQ